MKARNRGLLLLLLCVRMGIFAILPVSDINPPMFAKTKLGVNIGFAGWNIGGLLLLCLVGARSALDGGGGSGVVCGGGLGVVCSGGSGVVCGGGSGVACGGGLGVVCGGGLGVVCVVLGGMGCVGGGSWVVSVSFG